MMEWFLTFFGAAIGYGIMAIVAVSGITYWLFRLFAKNWLNNHFAERLQAFKHEQAKEIEQLRFEINALMDRTIKLHQHEFEVLPTLWSRLVMAHAHVNGITSGLQSYPDLSRMDDDQLEDFLLESSLSRSEQRELKDSHDKNAYYQRIENFKRAGKARSMYVKFHSYLRRKGVFVQPAIKDRFERFSDLLHGAMTEHELRLQHSDFRTRDEAIKLSKDGSVLLKEIELDVQARLWSLPLSGRSEPEPQRA